MSILQDKDKEYLKKEFSELANDVQLVLFTQQFECRSCHDTRELLEEAASLGDKIKLTIYDLVKDNEKAKQYKVNRVPALVVKGDIDYGIRLFGLPSGYEFASLIEDIKTVAARTTTLSPATKKQLSELGRAADINVFATPSCPHCQRAVITAHMMAVESEKITANMVMANEFPELASRYSVMAVPKVVINGETSFEGALPEESFVEHILQATR